MNDDSNASQFSSDNVKAGRKLAKELGIQSGDRFTLRARAIPDRLKTIYNVTDKTEFKYSFCLGESIYFEIFTALYPITVPCHRDAFKYFTKVTSKDKSE